MIKEVSSKQKIFVRQKFGCKFKWLTQQQSVVVLLIVVVLWHVEKQEPMLCHQEAKQKGEVDHMRGLMWWSAEPMHSKATGKNVVTPITTLRIWSHQMTPNGAKRRTQTSMTTTRRDSAAAANRFFVNLTREAKQWMWIWSEVDEMGMQRRQMFR